MINDKIIGKSSLRGKNYLLVDLELLRKEELAQRRKIRIQQVRLQSRDLANRVLQDVRNERKRHVKHVQDKQADLFKNWQSRKLDAINRRYKENIHTGQRAAAELPDPEVEILEQAKKNTEVAQERGKKAISQLRTEKEILRNEQEKVSSQRDKVKTLESIRAAMVSSLSSTKNTRKPDCKFTDSDAIQRSSLHGVQTGALAEMDEVTEDQAGGPVPDLVIPDLCIENFPTGERRVPATSSLKRAVPGTVAPPPSVEIYDRHNPSNITQRVPPTVRVERTSPQSQTNAREAAEMEEREEAGRQLVATGDEDGMRMKRGKKALAKEMVRRDFDRLMNRLNGLVREERVARGAGTQKLPAEIYMNEERTSLQIQKQQQNLESVFEGVLNRNKAINLREEPLPSEIIHQLPVVVEQARVPKKWLEAESFDGRKPGTFVQKLNLGICGHAFPSSPSGYEAEGSVTSTHSSLRADSAGTSEIEHAQAPAEVMPDERIPGRTSESRTTEVAGDDECHSQTKRKSPKAKAMRSQVERKDDGEDIPVVKNSVRVDECGHTSVDHEERNIKKIDVERKGSRSWWCSLITESVSAQSSTSDMAREGSEEMLQTGKRNATRRRSPVTKGETQEEKSSHVHRLGNSCVNNVETNDSPSSSSTSSSSWGLEEVQIVVRLDGLSPERDTLEKKDERLSRLDKSSSKMPGHRKPLEGRKKERVNAKQEQKLKEAESKTGPIVKSPDESGSSEEKGKVDLLSKDKHIEKDLVQKTERKRRDRKDVKTQRLGLPLPLSDSSYLSPPSHQDLSDTDRAKALLAEIRSQRRRLEEWVGSKKHEKGKMNPKLGNYVQKLLSMTRESIAELSVSDVSSPVFRETTPVSSDISSLVDRPPMPLPEKKFENKGVGTSFDDVLEEEKGPEMVTPALDKEKMSKLPKDKDLMTDVPDFDDRKSIKDAKVQTETHAKGRGSSPEVVVVDRSQLSPPSPPPPSPVYEELSVLHSRRISQLGARLMEIREMQKRLLTETGSLSDSDLKTSPSSSTKSNTEDGGDSLGKSDGSSKGEEVSSEEDSGPRKSWEVLVENSAGGTPELLHQSVSDDQDSEDSLTGRLLLESLQLTDPKKSFLPSEEVKANQRLGSSKPGPPPTAMKGGRWIGNDFQFPHELSTITEVDSRVFSTTSLVEPRKEKDVTTSGTGIQIHHPDPLDDPLSKLKTPEIIHLKRVKSPILKWDSGKASSRSELDKSKMVSPVAEESTEDLGDLQPAPNDVPGSVEIAKTQQEEEKSDMLTISSSISSEEGSTVFPRNLDEVLRMLGISPTILQGRRSPISGQGSSCSSPESSVHHTPAGISHTSVDPAKEVEQADLLLSVSGVEGDPGSRVLKESTRDSELQKSWLQFTPLGSFKDLSFGTSSSESKARVKSASKLAYPKDLTLDKSNFQSTPVGSLRDFTFGSESSSISEPKSKDRSGQATFRNSFNTSQKQALPGSGEKSDSGRKKSDKDSPHIPRDTTLSMLKHSTPLHSFSGEGSSSSTSDEHRKSSAGFPFLGDSAPSSISGGNGSAGADWRNIDDEDDCAASRKKEE